MSSTEAMFSRVSNLVRTFEIGHSSEYIEALSGLDVDEDEIGELLTAFVVMLRLTAQRMAFVAQTDLLAALDSAVDPSRLLEDLRAGRMPVPSQSLTDVVATVETQQRLRGLFDDVWEDVAKRVLDDDDAA